MRFFLSLAALAGAALTAAVSVGSADAVSACGRSGYSYAGLQSSAVAHGVRADLIALGNPEVENGHVAAWVGVGGPGQGAGGSDAWMQVGFSSFAGTVNNLYFEVTSPGAGTHYTQVEANVAPGSRHRVGVLEIRGRPGWWKVWVDGRSVSQPVYLPGSSGHWRPIATAETWDGGRPSCNLFSYSFGRVSVAGRGGAWRHFRSGYRFQDPGYRVVGSRNGFLARADRPLTGPTSVARAAEPAPAEQPTAPAAPAPEAATPEATADSAGG